jgi:hypothetical protein
MVDRYYSRERRRRDERQGQARLEAGLAETSAAVLRIIGLLDRDARPGE